jgi:hypothetical protein
MMFSCRDVCKPHGAADAHASLMNHRLSALSAASLRALIHCHANGSLLI